MVRVYNSVVTKHFQVNKDELANFCVRNHIAKLAFFGSVLREDFGASSDVDVLVDLEG